MLLNWVLHQRARRPIGFLSDPRRLNVAVSRAVAGLVIVGDLQHLARYSAEWKEIVRMGQEQGQFRGDPLWEEVPSSSMPLSAVPPEQASAAWSTLTAECPADLEAAAKIAREDAAKAAEDKDQTKLAAEVADEEKRKAEQAEQDRIRAEKNLLSAVKTADAQVGWLAAMSGVVE
ncbi:smg-2 [Symbiodinium sp. KB8]|nr:smg-2 [Symbiodinium sp. KB8]